MNRNIIILLTEGETDIRTLAPALTTYFRKGSRMLETGEPFRCDVTTIRLFPDNARNAGIMNPLTSSPS